MPRVIDVLVKQMASMGPNIKVTKQRFTLRLSQVWDVPPAIKATFPPSSRSTVLYNVIGELPGVGQRASEVIVISCHLDTTAAMTFKGKYDPRLASQPAPGTDDNGSGVVAVLKAARVLSQLYQQESVDPLGRRTYRFALFNAEEQGLIGSSYYAQLLKRELQQASANPKLPHVIAAFNLDTLGYSSQQVHAMEIHYGTSSDSSTPEFPMLENNSRDLALAVLKVQAQLLNHQSVNVQKVVQYQSPDPAAGRSDHSSFHRVNIPSVVMSEKFFDSPDSPADENPHYHTTYDNTIDAPFAASVIKIVVGSLIMCASQWSVQPSPQPLPAPVPVASAAAFAMGTGVPGPGGAVRAAAAAASQPSSGHVLRLRLELPGDKPRPRSIRYSFDANGSHQSNPVPIAVDDGGNTVVTVPLPDPQSTPENAYLSFSGFRDFHQVALDPNHNETSATIVLVDVAQDPPLSSFAAVKTVLVGGTVMNQAEVNRLTKQDLENMLSSIDVFQQTLARIVIGKRPLINIL